MRSAPSSPSSQSLPAVLAYLSRYTHRVAISNRRLIAADGKTVTFKVKDYRIDGPGRYKSMTLDAHEFIRRFLIHVLPTGFHRIRHYGLLASGVKADNLALARKMLMTRLHPCCRRDLANALQLGTARNVMSQGHVDPLAERCQWLGLLPNLCIHCALARFLLWTHSNQSRVCPLRQVTKRHSRYPRSPAIQQDYAFVQCVCRCQTHHQVSMTTEPLLPSLNTCDERRFVSRFIG
jgi:hypothetical protein